MAALFITTKLMGHKQVAQLDFFDYVSGITIGSIGAELATELESPERPLIALGVYALVALSLNLAARKIPAARKYINGAPTLLISGGRIRRDSLRRAKLDLSELMLLCRERGYFDLDEIEAAVFEHNGLLSVLPKSADRPATPKDLGIETAKAQLGIELIMDGRLLAQNLALIGRDERWLAARLRACGHRNRKSILLAIYHPSEDKLSVYE